MLVDTERLAGADQFARETFDKAAGLLATAESARQNRKGANAVLGAVVLLFLFALMRGFRLW